MPRVSVVLTAYNRAEPLRATLDSLLAQTFADFELLICDDASADHTGLVALEYAGRDNRVQYRLSPRNLGMPENLNQGILASRGQYIANLHDGDLYDCRLLEKWVAALDQNPGAAFVFNQYRTLRAGGAVDAILKEDLPAVFSGRRLLEDVYFRRWRFDSPVWGTVMARRAAYLAKGLFDPRFGCISDVDMWMKLAEDHDIAYVAEPLINLPAGESVPSNWKIPRSMLRGIFWESRMRHFRARPLRKLAEAIRHVAFGFAYRVYMVLVRASVTRQRLFASANRKEIVS